MPEPTIARADLVERLARAFYDAHQRHADAVDRLAAELGPRWHAGVEHVRAILDVELGSDLREVERRTVARLHGDFAAHERAQRRLARAALRVARAAPQTPDVDHADRRRDDVAQHRRAGDAGKETERT